jgi:hypothetical protein
MIPRARTRRGRKEFVLRPVTPVTRRELHEFGLVLYGEEPAALLPPVTGEQLAGFVVHDLEKFWLPSLDHPERWERDIWVDLDLLTLARATVTLRDGRLITKPRWIACRAELTLTLAGTSPHVQRWSCRVVTAS